jgi:hypothetical protein
MKPCTAIAAAILASAVLAVQAAPASPQLAAPLKGEVLEVLNAPSFTYLRLKTRTGEIWASVPTAPVKKGAEVTLIDPQMMGNFESKSLKRTFDKLVFATLADANGNAGATPLSPHGTPRALATPVVKVAKATGPDAKTVAEVVAGKAALTGKAVTIRGQVVKYSSGIMGKNWVHLQDGSGSAAGGDHDILLTTTDTTAVGAVVNASGTVRTNVDFGSGYAYAVMIEGGKIRK